MTRQAIYKQHDSAFSNVSAFVVLDKKKERIATIAFKFPRDGAGRLYCYFHVIGLPMVRGFAGGYGYDKKTAAFIDAARKANNVKLEDWQTGDYSELQELARDFQGAALRNDGNEWQNNLRDAGFTVLQAV